MRRLLALALAPALFAVVACGGDGSSPTDSGIEGLTVSGPRCPVEVAGSPCPDEPISFRLIITARGSSDTVASVTSGADGTFRVILEPGEYTIIPLERSGPPSLAPQDVIVRPHAFTKVTLEFDSGIR